MVTDAFPEARFVMVHQGNAPHPFGALPQIEMGNKTACRATVFRRKIFAVKSECDPRLFVGEVVLGADLWCSHRTNAPSRKKHLSSRLQAWPRVKCPPRMCRASTIA